MKSRTKSDTEKSGRYCENIQDPANVVTIGGINSYGMNRTLPRQEAIDTKAKKHAWVNKHRAAVESFKPLDIGRSHDLECVLS